MLQRPSSKPGSDTRRHDLTGPRNRAAPSVRRHDLEVDAAGLARPERGPSTAAEADDRGDLLDRGLDRAVTRLHEGAAERAEAPVHVHEVEHPVPVVVGLPLHLAGEM